MLGRKRGARSTRTWPIIRFTAVIFAVPLMGLSATPTRPAAAAERISTAALPFASDAPREIALPSVLSAADQVRYREIFRLQERGEWAEADAEIARLRDPLLLGHVEAHRLLHKKYRARY